MNTAASSARVELLLFGRWFLFFGTAWPREVKVVGPAGRSVQFRPRTEPRDRKPGPVDAEMTRLGTDEWRNNKNQTDFLPT